LWGNRTFSGRVIDADTLEPIEGAVVVAVWHKNWPGIGTGADTKFKMAREVLTDTNGEWSIKGPKGRQMTRENEWMEIFYLPFIYYTTPPTFIMYKPGYCKQFQKLGGFAAYPYEDEEKSLKGIILYRPGNTKEEVNEYKDRYKNSRAFIPESDPITKLKSSDFSFKYPENVMKIPKIDIDIYFWVTGLKKAETWEERRSAKTYDAYIPSTPPILRKMIKEEDEYLWGRGKIK